MKPNPQVSERKTSAEVAREPVRKPVLILIGVILLVCVGGALFVANKNKSNANPPPDTDAAAQSQAQTSVKVEDPVETTGAKATAPSTATRMAVPSVKRTGSLGEPADSRPEPAPGTRQLVGTLTQVDLSQPLTPEKAALWKQNMQLLTSQGAGAVPAIREFLEKNLDLNYDSASGNLLGQPSMRLSLLEALQNIGGADAMAVSSQILQTTLDPREIAWLAQSLEQQAPGQYGELAAEAARAALAMASTGQLEGRDVGPLFGVLQAFAGPEAADELKNFSGAFRYYSTIALANMPEGAGVSALVQMVQDPEALSKGGRAPALQMLAQLAPNSPEAMQALTEQARLNQIPSSTWLNIAALLSGDRMQIGTAPVESGIRSFHLSSGNQNFYSTPDRSPWPADQVNRYLSLVDQLLAVNNNPAAVNALQTARASLQARLQQ